jgi:hypothetical protein
MFSPKFVLFKDNLENHGRVRQAADDDKEVFPLAWTISDIRTLHFCYVIHRVSGGSTVGEESEKKKRCNDNLQKVQQKLTNVTADAENALLTECTQYNRGRRLIFGILPRK